MMRRAAHVLIILATACLPTLPGWPADQPSAREIMEMVEARDDGDNSSSDMEMVLIDRRGGERVRRIKSFARDSGDDTLSVMFFTYPPDVAGTGFLTYGYDEPGREDDQWLYLPALRKTKRIAGGSKSGSFMGSDFNYSDLASRDLDDFDYSLVKETEVDGAMTWVIESIPRDQKVIDETGYSKSLLLVRQDNHVIVRAVGWVKGGQDLRYMDVKRLELIDGIWVATEIHMTTKRNKETRHKTVLRFENMRFDQDLDDDLFTVYRLEQGL
jgi:hypothetical protein